MVDINKIKNNINDFNRGVDRIHNNAFTFGIFTGAIFNVKDKLDKDILPVIAIELSNSGLLEEVTYKFSTIYSQNSLCSFGFNTKYNLFYLNFAVTIEMVNNKVRLQIVSTTQDVGMGIVSDFHINEYDVSKIHNDIMEWVNGFVNMNVEDWIIAIYNNG